MVRYGIYSCFCETFFYNFVLVRLGLQLYTGIKERIKTMELF